MNVIVCVKQTPDSAATLKVEDQHVTWGDTPLVLNPWDEYAVEEAMLLKEKLGGKAVAISMGPESALDALKTCLAIGFEEAVLVSDPALKGSDAAATAYTLAKAIQKAGDAELALFGRQSIDAETGLTAAMAARFLGWTLLTQVAKIVAIDPAAKTIQVERLVDEGRQVCTAALPAVVSVVKGINEPRYPSFMGIRRAQKATIPSWSLADLGIDAGRVGVQGSAIGWPHIETVAAQAKKVEIIKGGSPAEIAAALADKLIAEKVL